MNQATERLSVLEKVGYSLGDLAANLIFQTLVTFLAFFYTDVYRIPPGTAASIIFGVGIVGAFVFTHESKKVSKEPWEQAQPKVKFPSGGDQRLEAMNVITHTTRPNGTPAVVKPGAQPAPR